MRCAGGLDYGCRTCRAVAAQLWDIAGPLGHGTPPGWPFGDQRSVCLCGQTIDGAGLHDGFRDHIMRVAAPVVAADAGLTPTAGPVLAELLLQDWHLDDALAAARYVTA